MEVSLTEADSVIIVAHHLPLRVERAPDGNGFSIGWDDERGLDKNGMKLPTETMYIGCIELDVPDLDEQEALEKLLLEQWGCIVVFLPPDMRQRYYHGFCRGYLSPIMHNQMHITASEDPFNPEDWRAYCQVNQLFASKVLEVYEPGTMIWVHDYHLMLLPSCIVRKMHLAKIGFFLHAPFPASDVWRTVSVRLELLRALLNVDLIGFLMFEYTRNFLTCCKRMLGLEYEFQRGGFLGVEYEGRHVILQVSTFGISPAKVESRLEKLSALQTAPGRRLRVSKEEYGGRTLNDVLRNKANTIIGAVDYLDRLKGVACKLLAWEALLRDYPHYRTGHVLVQVCVGARNRIQIQTAPAVEAELRTIVNRINAAYPGAVHFEVRGKMTSLDRLQLWLASYMMFNTVRCCCGCCGCCAAGGRGSHEEGSRHGPPGLPLSLSFLPPFSLSHARTRSKHNSLLPPPFPPSPLLLV